MANTSISKSSSGRARPFTIVPVDTGWTSRKWSARTRYMPSRYDGSVMYVVILQTSWMVAPASASSWCTLSMATSACLAGSPSPTKPLPSSVIPVWPCRNRWLLARTIYRIWRKKTKLPDKNQETFSQLTKNEENIALLFPSISAHGNLRHVFNFLLSWYWNRN